MRTLPEVLNGALQPNEAVLLCPDCAKQQTFQTTPGGNAGGDSENTGSALQGRDIGSTKGGGVITADFSFGQRVKGLGQSCGGCGATEGQMHHPDCVYMRPDGIVAKPVNDPVSHPKHYTGHASGIECIQITEHMGFNLGNAVKYIWRCDLKQDAIEDLKKARWYLEREIAKRIEWAGKLNQKEK